jgi:hypothetical protein
VKMEDITCEGYDLEFTPAKASVEKKSGMTFKGNDGAYLNAQSLVKSMFQKKGERFSINEIEISVLDVPIKKPINIEIKPKVGLSGKANIKIFELNSRGGATIFISKVSGGDFVHVKTLGLRVIKYLIDGIMNGSINEEDLEKYKKKNVKVAEEKTSNGVVNTCQLCDKVFQRAQGLKLHMTRMHKKLGVTCERCEKPFNDE